VEGEWEIDTGNQLDDLVPGSAFNGVSEKGLTETQLCTPILNAEITSSYDRFPDMSLPKLLQISPETCISDLMRADLYVQGTFFDTAIFISNRA
jgi:hypothetical protein